MNEELINEIQKQIIEGVELARSNGVVCFYPNSFAIKKVVEKGGKQGEKGG